MEKDFFDVFPNLKVKKELEELLEMVTVTRVSCNISLNWRIRLKGSFSQDLNCE